MISPHQRVATSVASCPLQRVAIGRVVGKFRLLAAIVCCVLVGAGCSVARQNKPAPSRPAGTPSAAAIVEGPPAVAPPRHSSARATDRAAWAQHSKAGRESLALGHYREAEDEFVIALRVSGGYGPTTQRQATSLANLERVATHYQSSPSDLIRITRVILPIAIDLRGRSDPSVADHSYALGGALVTSGQFEDARDPLQRALSIYRARAGADSPEVARVHLWLANLERGVGNLTAAEEQFQRALEIEERLVGAEDPALATTLAAYAGLLMESDRTGEAETMLLRATAATASAGGLTEAQALNSLAWFYTQNERPAEAEPLARRALERLAGQRVTAAQLASVLDTLGLSLMQQAKYEEAEVHLARAFELSRGKLTPPFDAVQRDYARLLRETDRPQEAAAVEAGQSPTVGAPDTAHRADTADTAAATETAAGPAPQLPAEETAETSAPAGDQ